MPSGPLRLKVEELVAVFSRMSDPYLKERGRDVEEVPSVWSASWLVRPRPHWPA